MGTLGDAWHGQEEGDPAWGGRSPGLALAMLWSLLQCGSWQRPPQLSFFTGSLELEKFSGPKRHARLC